MPQLLHLDSSADLLSSRSRAITARFAEAWRAVSPAHTVVHRDLHRNPLPHLSDARLHWPARLRLPAPVGQLPGEELQQELLAELAASDALLVGAPMYNYSLPSTLKVWVDNIHVPGVMAPFDVPTQPMAGRPAVIVAARGASYDPGSPSDGWDHAVPALSLILGKALGMQVSVIAANLTLADSVPALAEFADRGHAEFDAAQTEAARLGRELGEALDGA